MVYHPTTVPSSHVCPNEFSRSKLLTSVKVTDWADAGVYGWVGRSEKLNRMTSVDCAPKVLGEARATVDCLDPFAPRRDTSGSRLDPSALRLDTSAPVSSSSIPLRRAPRTRTRAPVSSRSGGFRLNR